MNPQDPLAALHPLRAPAAIGWWPPAPGWWALLATLIVLALAAVYLARRWHRRNAYRRVALQQLDRAQQAFRADGNAGNYLAGINALLKSVALCAYPRTDIAGIHGSAWRTFLNQGLPPALHLQDAFDNAPYQRTCADLDPEKVYGAARYWIKKHRAAP